MWRTFNNGIGMILVIKAEEVEGVLNRLGELGRRLIPLERYPRQREKPNGWSSPDRGSEGIR
jgi:phosphoribosylaminoimidazole (AIR) synthetase